MNCRGCAGSPETVLDLGMHRLPDFTDPGIPPPPAYPLELVLCPSCGLLQLGESAPRDALYHDRYGFRSGVNEAVRADLGSVAATALAVVPEPRRWLDIASNDGTLLSHVPAGVYRCGIDPLAHLAPEAERHADRIIPDYFSPGYFGTGEFDVVTSVSMFYDLDDPGEFCAQVGGILAPGGVWACQQNYALDMIRNNAVDNVCAEHVTYFTVTAMLPLLERAGLECNDVTWSTVNGGCFRAVISHRGARPVRGSVCRALDLEQRAGLSDAATWKRWGEEVTAGLGETAEYLHAASRSGKRTWLYGASTRGGTILQVIGAGPDLLPYAVERQAAKVGRVMAATGIPIISEEQMRADPPDALLISPWFFRDVFVKRERAFLEAGGVMVFPLPRFEVVSA